MTDITSNTTVPITRAKLKILTLIKDEQDTLYRASYDGQVATIRKAIPNHIQNAIKDLGSRNGLVAFLVKGVPIDQVVPQTPRNALDCNKKSMPIADLMLTAFSIQAGPLQEFEGKVDIYKNSHVHNLYPIVGNEYTQLGSNSCTLDWHVEDGFLQDYPNLCALLCVRSSDEAETLVSFAKNWSLKPDVDLVLREPRFVIDYDETFEIKGEPLKTAIISGPSDDPEIRVDFPVTRGLDAKAELALTNLRTEMDATCQRVVLEQGDLLFFDNRKVVHGRNAYTPSYNGDGRWLKRVLISERRADSSFE